MHARVAPGGQHSGEKSLGNNYLRWVPDFDALKAALAAGLQKPHHVLFAERYYFDSFLGARI